jgi:nitroimidazol reductase NimA-like FMN-containing flavoprotein (pyridoxamine 5'-phosphate oxidase superfamily)
MAQEMTPEEYRSFLTAGTRTAKVATVGADVRPHVVPIWFVLDGDTVVLTTGDRSAKALLQSPSCGLPASGVPAQSQPSFTATLAY